MVKFFTIIALTLVQLHFAFASAVNGGGSTGGGDKESIQFVHIATAVQEALLRAGPDAIAEVDANTLKTAISETQVESTDEVLELDGIKKDALNYPDEKRIVFNRERWMESNINLRRALVLHEYLGIMRVDDSNYQVSSKVLSLKELSTIIDVCSRGPVGNAIARETHALDCHAVDASLMAQIEDFDLPAEFVPKDAFQGMPSLKRLRFSGCQGLALIQGSFDGLEHLKSLTFEGCLMTVLRPGVLRKLRSLKELNLFGNLLSDLEEGVFSDLVNLESLSLMSNQLWRIPSREIGTLRKLKKLWISSSAGWWPDTLETIKANAFVGLDKLEFLNLGDHGNLTIEADAFAGLPRLKKLMLWGNNIESISRGKTGLSNRVDVDIPTTP